MQTDFDGDVEEHLETLAAYVLHTDGAPCLRRLNLPYFMAPSPLGTRFQPLFDRGGFANLTSLHSFSMTDNAIEQLGSIYRAGGLAKLESLTFRFVEFDEQTMGALMDGVLASGHRGAALRELDAGMEVDSTPGASLIFIKALKDGAFPNLEVLWESPEYSFFDEVDGGDVLKRAFLAAMAGGAACARTLRSVDMGDLTKKHLRAFKKALPGIDYWPAAVDVVKEKKQKKTKKEQS